MWWFFTVCDNDSNHGIIYDRADDYDHDEWDSRSNYTGAEPTAQRATVGTVDLSRFLRRRRCRCRCHECRLFRAIVRLPKY